MKHLAPFSSGSFFITNVSWGEQQKYWANLDRLMWNSTKESWKQSLDPQTLYFWSQLIKYQFTPKLKLLLNMFLLLSSKPSQKKTWFDSGSPWFVHISWLVWYVLCIYLCILCGYVYWFPKIGVPPNHPFPDVIFHYKPNILGKPHLWKPPHISYYRCYMSICVLYMSIVFSYTTHLWIYCIFFHISTMLFSYINHMC